MIRRLHALPTIQNALMLGLLMIAGLAAQTLAPDAVEVRLWLVGLLAGVLGLALGLWKMPDSISHLMAIAVGLGGAVALAASSLPHESVVPSFLDRFVAISSAIRDWYLGIADTHTGSDLLMAVLLQMIVWLIAYLAAWSLARRSWLTVALTLPTIVVLGAQLLGAGLPRAVLELYFVVAIMLLARTTWLKRSGVDHVGARRRGWLSLVIATVIGVMVVSLGAATPEGFSRETLRPMADYASQQFLSAQNGAGTWLADQLDVSPEPGTVDIDDFPRYTAFDDAFSVGGQLNLSAQPEVLVRTNGKAPYLSAQSYDHYNGRGWESTVEETFDAEGSDGVRYSPELTFRSGQKMPYSESALQARRPMSMTVTPLTPAGERMFTSGMYLTADQKASVRMSWRQLDHTPFPLRQMDLATVPPDLTGIAALLLDAPRLTVEGDDGVLYPPSAPARERLQTMRAQLAERFIDVSWTVADDGRVDSLFVTGQLPVYDDPVAVSEASDTATGRSYEVASLMSAATAQQLRVVPDVYPDWVSDRYLQLPSTVTPRTRELTNRISEGTSDPYDQAKRIEQYLRQHITYDLQVGVPPEDADIVDYVLFEQSRGYCEYYASAMTVMMRILGVPAKTVVGYFPADYDQGQNGYLYRQENAHAWTEVWFPGYGWIRFEPTASQPASSFNGSDDTLPPPVTPTAEPTPTPTPPVATPVVATTPPTEAPPVMPGVVPETPDDDGGRNWPLLAGGAAVLLSVAAVIGWLLLTRSPMLEARSMFTSLVRWGQAGGVGNDPMTTPREYARRFGHRYPNFAPEANDIVDVYEEQRYGGRQPDPTRLQQAAAGLRHLRRAILRRIIRVGR